MYKDDVQLKLLLHFLFKDIIANLSVQLQLVPIFFKQNFLESQETDVITIVILLVVF